MRLLPILFLVLNSCAGSIETRFEDLPGAPADYVNRTYCREGDAPGTLRVITGKREAGGYWGEGGGLIAESMQTLWSRGLDWGLMRWDRVKRDEVKDEEPPDGALRSFLVQYVASGIISASWQMRWIHTVTAGTSENPKQVIIQFQKIKGTGFIKHWKGSFVLTRAGPKLTAFAMRFELDALAQGEKAADKAIRRYFGKFHTGE